MFRAPALDMDAFASPKAEYRPIPFWFWNADLRVDELLEQLERMRDMGCGGAFIHARFGFDGDYLGPSWFAAIREVCVKALELGMHIWLYDENPFPSGIGGLRVTARPEFRAKYLEAVDLPAGAVPDPEGLLAAGRPDAAGSIRAVYRRVLAPTNGKVFGPDYLNPDAMAFFMDMTHEVYDKNLGEFFGNAIRGFFTDEPTLLPWHHDLRWYGLLDNRRVAPWSQLVPDALRQEGIEGEELAECLLALFDDERGSDEASFLKRAGYRNAFWRCVARLYEESFAKPYARWCSERGLMLTGHLLLEEGLYTNTLFEADPLAVLSHFDIPGTDHLGAQTEYAYGGFEGLPKMLTNVQGQKLVSSAAHAQGRARVLSETYGCAGWGLDLQTAKKVYDWQLCMGVNFLCPHAFFQSVEGFRKTDAPPCFLHNVSSREYRLFADYAGRASYLLSQGAHVARVALWYPLESFWAGYSPGTTGGDEAAVSESFDIICSALTRLRYDYDILNTAALAAAKTEAGRLVVAKESFEVVIVPEARWMPPALVEALRRFEAAGVRVIRMSDVEPRLGRKLEPAAGALAKLLVGVSPVLELQPQTLDVLAVARRIEPSGELVFFLCNDSPRTYSGVASGLEGSSVRVLDLETGTATQVPLDGGLPVHLLPGGSMAFVTSPSAPAGPLVNSEPVTLTAQSLKVTLGPRWVMEPLDDNALPLDSWTMRLRSGNCWESYSYYTSVVWQGADLPSRLFLLLDDIEYREAFMGSMDVKVVINGAQAATMSPSSLDPRLRLVDVAPFFKTGDNDIEVVITHSAWSGQPRTLTSIPKLMGRFRLVSSVAARAAARQPDAPPVLTAASPVDVLPASWTELGYPFYSGTMRYSATIDAAAFEVLTSAPEHWSICVLEAMGGLANSMRVQVGGISAGVRAWPPWRVAFPADMVTGSRNIRVDIDITNTSQNMLEGEVKPSGLFGPVVLRRQAFLP